MAYILSQFIYYSRGGLQCLVISFEITIVASGMVWLVGLGQDLDERGPLQGQNRLQPGSNNVDCKT